MAALGQRGGMSTTVGIIICFYHEINLLGVTSGDELYANASFRPCSPCAVFPAAELEAPTIRNDSARGDSEYSFPLGIIVSRLKSTRLSTQPTLAHTLWYLGSKLQSKYKT